MRRPVRVLFPLLVEDVEVFFARTARGFRSSSLRIRGGSLPPPVESADEPPPPDLTDPYNAPDCDGVRVIIITASADPDWSFAALPGRPSAHQLEKLAERCARCVPIRAETRLIGHWLQLSAWSP